MTKGVPNQRLILHAGPSDRIGSNFTLTAKHLRLKVIREERIRRARMKTLMREEGLLPVKPPPTTVIPKTPKPKKQEPYTKFGKLVSRPPKRPR